MGAKVIHVAAATTSSRTECLQDSAAAIVTADLANASSSSELRRTESALRRQPAAENSVAAFREIALGDGVFRRELTAACVPLSRAHRGDILEASITYKPNAPRSEVVVKIERLRDRSGASETQCERMQLRIKAFGVAGRRIEPQRQNEVVEFITASLRSQLAREVTQRRTKIDYGKLVCDIRKLDNGHLAVSEISAENVSLEFNASGSQPIVLDGIVLKDCGNLTIVGNRTNEEKTDGIFSVLAPYMVLDGGFGGITIKGVDCSKLRLVNLDDSRISMLRFVECQLRGARADGVCSLQIFSAWDCSLGEGVDLASLSVRNPPRSIEEFKVVFGGTIWTKNGSVVLPSNFEFERFKGLLEEISSSHAASTMLSKRCEVSLANLVQGSTALSPRVTESGEDTKMLEISFANEERVIVSCRRYPPLHGWRVSDVSVAAGAEDRTTSIWRRKRTFKPEDVAALEAVVDDLFDRKFEERKRLGRIDLEH